MVRHIQVREGLIYNKMLVKLGLMIPFLEGRFGSIDGCGGCGSRLSEQTKSQMADIHDRPGLVNMIILICNAYNN